MKTNINLNAITDPSKFPSAIINCPVILSTGKWYYEVHMQTCGVMQLGWATCDFKPNFEEGDGVGDCGQSFGYDGGRGEIYFGGESGDYGGGSKWEDGDIVGCLIDAGDGEGGSDEISYSLNGVDLGVAFDDIQGKVDDRKKGASSSSSSSSEKRRGWRPAVSMNGGERVLIETGGGEEGFKYRPEGYFGVGEAKGAEEHWDTGKKRARDEDISGTDSGNENDLKQPKKKMAVGDADADADTDADAGNTPMPAPVSPLMTLPTPTQNPTESDEQPKSFPPLDLTKFSSVEEITAVGLDRLKDALQSRGLKCGGSAEERAKRLWFVKNLGEGGEIPKKLKAKGK